MDGFVGLIFRREPTVKLPERVSGVAGALRVFAEAVDLLGTSLYTFSKNIVSEVLTVGRAGTLVDWEGEGEQRGYAVRYAAEQILNWRVSRVNGRNLVTLVVLRPIVPGSRTPAPSGIPPPNRARFPPRDGRWPRLAPQWRAGFPAAGGRDGHRRGTQG